RAGAGHPGRHAAPLVFQLPRALRRQISGPRECSVLDLAKSSRCRHVWRDSMQSVSSSSVVSQTATPRGARALGFVALGVALLTVWSWVIWYAGGRDLLASSPTPEYFAFENAFPAADGWLALCALISGIQLLRGRSSAIYWLFLTAGCGLYLGLMDVLF